MLQKTIPYQCDVAKAAEFYIEWPGFKTEFEHQFEENTPYYIGITKDDIQLHLNIMVMQHQAAKYLLFVMKLKNILLNCKAGLINIIDPVWKKHFTEH